MISCRALPDVRPHCARRERVAPDAPAHLAHARRDAERQPSGREPIEDDAEREDVAAPVGAHAQKLLGCHVFGGSHQIDELPRAGEDDDRGANRPKSISTAAPLARNRMFAS